MADTTPDSRRTGTDRVKRGLAEMLRGGVIMDVVDAEQAKVAEDAGAVAVMALERVPSDIRRDGGVARMSDPALIEGIKAVVTIPVMAKARIGHFAEAQVLEALGVDYIDESEVLTPADELHHIDKWNFTVPFVCGATNLGEALRRISEGAAMIRSKGEAGTGDVVHAVRHLRQILGDIKRIGQADSAELYGWAKNLQAPVGLVQEIAETGKLPVPMFCAGGIATPADAVARHAARRRVRLRRLGHLQEREPGPRWPGPSSRRPPTSGTRRSWPRSAAASATPCGARTPTWSRPSCPSGAGSALVPGRPPGGADRQGRVLALQGAVGSTRPPSLKLGAHPIEVRTPEDLAGVEALILPGGESTTMSLLLESSGLFEPIAERLADDMPAFGTCAGMILLASDVLDGRPDQRFFGAIDLTVRRNAFGRQVDSFETGLAVDGVSTAADPFDAVFIRAPFVERAGEEVEVLATVDGHPVLCRSGNVLVSAFHPELSDDLRIHELFLRRLKPCPVIPSGRRSSTRRVPRTRRAGSSSPSSSARSRWRRARAAETRR